MTYRAVTMRFASQVPSSQRVVDSMTARGLAGYEPFTAVYLTPKLSQTARDQGLRLNSQDRRAHWEIMLCNGVRVRGCPARARRPAVVDLLQRLQRIWGDWRLEDVWDGTTWAPKSTPAINSLLRQLRDEIERWEQEQTV